VRQRFRRPALRAVLEHRLREALVDEREEMAPVDLAPRRPAEHGGTIHHHDPLHGGIDARREEATPSGG
jgi:hypothetical protein